LTNLLKKDEKFVWNKAIKPLENYEIFHIRIYYSIPFTYTYLHFTKPFVVTTNASGYAIGGLLSQEIIGKNLSIVYTSRLIRPNRELFHHRKRITRNNIQRIFFRPYIYGREFTLVTNHQPLK